MKPFAANTKADEEQLTDSQLENARFNEKYINPSQMDQSFNSLPSMPSQYKRRPAGEHSSDGVNQLSDISKVSSHKNAGKIGKSIGVIPEELTFEDVPVVLNSKQQLQFSSTSNCTKLLLKNNMSSRVELEIG